MHAFGETLEHTQKTGVYAFLSNIIASEAIETLPTDTRLVL